MTMKRVLSIVGIALAATMFLAGCSSDSYNREEAIDDLVNDGGMTEEQAVCIVDAVEDEFGIETLNANREPTPEEDLRISELALDCLDFGDIDIDDPTVSIDE
jgi:polyhydroxyalkanoate synthesis regulator phasin